MLNINRRVGDLLNNTENTKFTIQFLMLLKYGYIISFHILKTIT